MAVAGLHGCAAISPAVGARDTPAMHATHGPAICAHVGPANPAMHAHEKLPAPSTHVPPLAHGGVGVPPLAAMDATTAAAQASTFVAHVEPVHPGAHAQTKPANSSVQTPPCWHGADAHSLASASHVAPPHPGGQRHAKPTVARDAMHVPPCSHTHGAHAALVDVVHAESWYSPSRQREQVRHMRSVVSVARTSSYSPTRHGADSGAHTRSVVLLPAAVWYDTPITHRVRLAQTRSLDAVSGVVSNRSAPQTVAAGHCVSLVAVHASDWNCEPSTQDRHGRHTASCVALHAEARYWPGVHAVHGAQTRSNVPKHVRDA